MKILIICSGNYANVEKEFAIRRPFIFDQIKVLEKLVDKVDVFFIKEKGLRGYSRSIFKLRKIILNSNYNLIHAHYGFSGLVGCMASILTKIPVVTTFHGTDITLNKNFLVSIWPIIFSKHSIFVSEKLKNKARMFLFSSRYSVISCGVNMDLFHPKDKSSSCDKLNLDFSKKRILFSSAFNNPIKNFPLASAAVKNLKEDVEFLQIKNRSRAEVALLLNASDVLLLTSFTEGSPQIIKEAMACNCPIVSTDVGDVKNIVGDAQNCYIVPPTLKDLSERIQAILINGKRSDGRNYISGYDNYLIARKILRIYTSII